MAGFNHFPDIAAALPEISQGTIVDPAASRAVENIQAQIEANGQIRTGYMLSSVHVEDGEDEYSRTVVVGADYGIYQNYGTRFIPARPFFEPGLEQTQGDLDGFLSEAAQQIEAAGNE